MLRLIEHRQRVSFQGGRGIINGMNAAGNTGLGKIFAEPDRPADVVLAEIGMAPGLTPVAVDSVNEQNLQFRLIGVWGLVDER